MVTALAVMIKMLAETEESEPKLAHSHSRQVGVGSCSIRGPPYSLVPVCPY